MASISRLTLTDFRSYASASLEAGPGFVLLFGENGAGKTNLLEAVSILAPGRGLRGAALSEMARQGGNGGWAVAARLGDADIGTGTLAAAPERRQVRVNGAPASVNSLSEWLSILWLTPAMDRLFADSAGARRRYMDRLALALDPVHARHVARYEAALRERNRLLTEAAEPDPQWLDSIELQLAEAGAALAAGRTMLVERLSAELAALPEAPFARPALALAASGPRRAPELAHELSRHRQRDRAAQRTLTGPHRDDLEVTMVRPGAGKGVPAASCSTGEQKALLIAITLAHAGLAAAGRPGVLLLDEVAAHLDPVRRETLFERLGAGKAQVWLTGTERAPFAGILGEAATWRVSGGQVERLA